MIDKVKWQQPWIAAQIWYCGDEQCDCRQAQVFVSFPNLQVGYPWRGVEVIWQGEFVSQPVAFEMEMMKEELRVAALQFGLELDARSSACGILV